MSATAASTDALTAALGELATLGTDPDRAAITDLTGRVAGQRLRILVAGEAKRGKSTLVNALLGRPVLPVGVTPLTALATTVRHGPADKVTVRTGDGQIRQYPLSALDDLVTERGNPGNVRNLSAVTVSVNAPLLAHGVELVDTPGTGSVHRQNTAEADQAIATMDAAIFVLSADPPVSASERDLIARVAGDSVAMFVVLNKADRLSGTDLTEVLEFTDEVTTRAAGRPVGVYPVSARAALSDDGDPGFARFLADLTGYLDARRDSDLRRSVERHARRMALSLRDEVLLARRAGRSQGAEADQRVRAFAAKLAEVRDRRSDAADLVAAEARRLLAALNQAAVDDAAAAARRVGADLDDLLGGALGSASAGEIDRAGQARLAELAVRAAWGADADEVDSRNPKELLETGARRHVMLSSERLGPLFANVADRDELGPLDAADRARVQGADRAAAHQADTNASCRAHGFILAAPSSSPPARRERAHGSVVPDCRDAIVRKARDRR
jgi:small GTP-binding protein